MLHISHREEEEVTGRWVERNNLRDNGDRQTAACGTRRYKVGVIQGIRIFALSFIHMECDRWPAFIIVRGLVVPLASFDVLTSIKIINMVSTSWHETNTATVIDCTKMTWSKGTLTSRNMSAIFVQCQSYGNNIKYFLQISTYRRNKTLNWNEIMKTKRHPKIELLLGEDWKKTKRKSKPL